MATVLHTPITWKKLINQLMHIENNYSAYINNKIFNVNENIFNRVENYKGITKCDSKMNECILCVVFFYLFYFC